MTFRPFSALLFLLIIQTTKSFFTYAPQNQQSYPNTPVPRGYQPPPNPPLAVGYEEGNQGNRWRQNNQWPQQNNQWQRPNNQWNQNPNNQWNQPQNNQWNENQQRPQNQWQSNQQHWQQPQNPVTTTPKPREPIFIKTLIQVFANENDPSSLYSEATTVTRVDGDDRVQIARELDTKTGTFTMEGRQLAASNPSGLAHVKAYAATNASHITDKELERELDRELETAIPLILEKLDQIAKNNGVTTTPPPDDINSKDLEKLISDALDTIDDPEKKKEVQEDLEKIKSITKGITTQQTTPIQIPTETTQTFPVQTEPPTSAPIQTEAPTSAPVQTEPTTTTVSPPAPEVFDETTQELIIFTKTTATPTERIPETEEDHNEEVIETTTITFNPDIFKTETERPEPLPEDNKSPESENDNQQSNQQSTEPISESPSSQPTPEETVTQKAEPTDVHQEATEPTEVKPAAETTEANPETSQQNENTENDAPSTTTASSEVMVPEAAANGDETKEHPRTWKPRPATTATEIPTQPGITSTPEGTTSLPIETDEVDGTVQKEAQQCPVPNDESDTLKGDVLFLIDGSEAVKNGVFGNGLKLISDTVKQFDNIGPSGVQFSLLQYNNEPFLEFSFRKHKCITDLIENIQNTKPREGDADVGRAIEKVMKYAFTKTRGERPNVDNVLVLVSDNVDENQLQLPLELVRKDGASMLVVATVKGDLDDLDELANTADSDAFDLKNIKSPLSKRLAKKIKEVLKGEHKEAHVDDNIFVTPAVSHDDLQGTDENTQLTTEVPHHLPASYSNENVQIDCQSDGVTATFKVPEYFAGFIAAKGFETDPDCSINVPQSDAHSENLRDYAISVKVGQCGLNSITSGNPRGRNHSVIIGIYHHQDLITDQDQSYVVQCFIPRRHLEHTLSTKLDVDPVTAISTTIALDAAPPTCEYTVRRDSPNGPILTSASIGQIVYHRWECKATDDVTSAYGLHVHNCVASNGNNNSFEIINNDGCSVDNSLLGEVEYADGKILAHVRSHVFTFVNLKSLLFSCRVTLCLRDGDGCEGVSPPVCESASHNVLLTRRTRQLDPSVEAALTQNVQTPTLELIDAKKPVHFYRIPISVYFVVIAVFILAGLLLGYLIQNCRSEQKPVAKIKVQEFPQVFSVKH